MQHTHRASPSRSTDRGWTTCVTPDECAARPERQSAHGGIVRIDVCSCGAVRRTEINGRRRNRGPWRELGATE